MIRFDERGSAAIEAAVAGPAMVLLILLVVFGGRVALAHHAVQDTAADTARAASLARTQPEARSAATAAMDASPQPATHLHRPGPGAGPVRVQHPGRHPGQRHAPP